VIRLENALCNLVSDMNARWALVGRLACSARGEPITVKSLEVVTEDDPSDNLVSTGWKRIDANAVARPSGIVARWRSDLPRRARQKICALADVVEVLPGVSVPVSAAPELLAMAALDRDYQAASLLAQHVDRAGINAADESLRFWFPDRYPASGHELRAMIRVDA
jgi:hypothetical protein